MGTLMLAMQAAGAIDNLTFALWYKTGDFDEYHGEYTFGAIDHSKYLGKLTAVPINEGRVTVDNYEYYEEGNEAAEYSEADPMKLPFIMGTTTMLDMGGIKTFLYKDALDKIFEILGAKDGKLDPAVVKARKPVIVYSMGNGTYRVKLNLADRIGDTGEWDHFKGIGPTLQDNSTMGPGFFKQVYSVWDYENRRMLFAERNPNPGAPDIHVLTEDDIKIKLFFFGACSAYRLRWFSN